MHSHSCSLTAVTSMAFQHAAIHPRDIHMKQIYLLNFWFAVLWLKPCLKVKTQNHRHLYLLSHSMYSSLYFLCRVFIRHLFL